MKKTFLLLFLFLSLSNVAFALDPLVRAEDERDYKSKAIADGLASKSSETRARVALALGRIRNPESISKLMDLLGDESSEVRKEAAFALGQFGWEEATSAGKEKDIALKLKEVAMKEKDYHVRAMLVEAIGKVGLLESPDLVLPFLKDESFQVVESGLLALYRYRLVLRLRNPSISVPELPTEVFEAMKSLAATRELLYRRNVAYYFARIKDVRGLELLEDLAKDSDMWTRLYAVGGLGRIANKSSLPTFLKTSKDVFGEIRLAAINGVVALGEAHKLDPNLVKDRSFHVRTSFASALADVKASEDKDTLINPELADKLVDSLIADKSPTVQGAALQTLAKRKNKSALATLALAQKKGAWPVREAVASTLPSLGEEAIPLIKNALKDKSPIVRSSAIDGISANESAWVYEAIQNALTSKEISERGTAIQALGQRKETSKFELAWKTYQNSKGDKWIEAREELTGLIAGEKSEATTKYLKEILKDPIRSVALKANKALRDRGVEDLPPLPEFKLTVSPYRELTFRRDPIVSLTTTKGIMWIQCFSKDAQIHVANFVGFAENGKYNGLPWHRVVSNFVIQGGDPDKTGWGDAGYKLRAEINHQKFHRGAVGMPRNSDFDTGGVQIFVNHVPTPHLDGQYTVFGQVIKGLEVIDKIEKGDLILNATVF